MTSSALINSLTNLAYQLCTPILLYEKKSENGVNFVS